MIMLKLDDEPPFKYEFTKIKADHDRLRDDVILCRTCSPLLVGEPAILMTDSKTPGMSLRMIRTSPVVKVLHPEPKLTEIHTESGSVYEIREL